LIIELEGFKIMTYIHPEEESPLHRESHKPHMTHLMQAEVCSNAAWEAAYARFETPEQEIRKFTRRLLEMGAAQWAHDVEIVELCCGRGNGLHALSKLGFTRLEGVDLSASLLAHYAGQARLYVCDCRRLPFDDVSRDVVIVQGGLHHLLVLPNDLEQTLSETHRILRNEGLIVVVEPWLTPFLAFVHRACQSRIVGRVFPKLEALATMIHHERHTYDQWLSHPQMIVHLFEKFFFTVRCSIKWGKYMFVGRKRI
jgi:ubiquinone/menaquinone biosynthesis C-methylase UbiE